MMRTFCFLLLASLSLWAKEVPLTQSMTIYIPLKSWSVIELPFKIQEKSFTPFVSMVKKGDLLAPLKEQIEIPTISEDESKLSKKSPSKGKRPPQRAKKNEPLEYTFGENVVQLYPKKKGSTELLIWGHKYPVILKLVVDDELGESHYRFIDYDQQRDLAADFESDPHITVCQKLTKSLYEKKAPKGYREKSYFAEYVEGGRKHVLVQTFFGKRYIGEEWRVTNVSNERDVLYNEQFLDVGIYSASVENDVLLPGETTRVFVVRAYEEKHVGIE